MRSDKEANGAAARRGEGGAPKTDPAAAIEFLRALYPEGPWALAALDAEGKRGPLVKTFGPAGEDACRAWIEQHNQTCGIYYHVNAPRQAVAKKAAKADIAALRFLYVDIDPRAGEDLAEERERALGRLQSPPGNVPPPTCIIDSGGGFQALWRLREPVRLAPDDAIEDAKLAAAAEAERYTRHLEATFGADKCHNVDRLLRLPGTVNWPNAKKRAKGRAPALAQLVEQHPERVYDIGQFEQAQPPLAASGGSERRAQVDAGNVHRFASVDEVSDRLSDRAKVAIVQGHDPDEPNRFPSRSEALFYACCEMARAGCDDQAIYSVITDPNFGISDSVLELGGRAERYARRQIERARSELAANAEDFDTNENGRPVVNQANIRRAVAKLGVTVEHDDFADRDSIRGLEGFGPYLDDKAMTRLRLQVDEQFGLRVPKDFFYDVVTDLALSNRRHPVREYLDRLAWDGSPRLERWLSTYAGAEENDYTRAVGALVLVAAVRRVRQPGCKFDEMLVLEGPQGRGKSTLLRTLATEEDWFSDDLPLNADTKRQMEAIAGRWIVEAGELKGMRKGEVEALKGFLSRRVDRARLAYGRATTELPRQCVIIGTTNSERYLRDTTGNRRFWPVRTSELRLAELERDRHQLWAEAAIREAEGAAIRLDPALYPAAAEAQGERLVGDPFMEILEPMLDGRVGKIGAEAVWRALDRADRTRRTQDDSNRLGEVMRTLEWERAYRRIDGLPQYVYAKGEPGERERVLTVEGGEGGWRVVEVPSGKTAADYRAALTADGPI